MNFSINHKITIALTVTKIAIAIILYELVGNKKNPRNFEILLCKILNDLSLFLYNSVRFNEICEKK